MLTVGLSFLAASHIQAVGWRLLALCGFYLLLRVLYIQRFPRVVALEYALKLKSGQKVEVEGK